MIFIGCATDPQSAALRRVACDCVWRELDLSIVLKVSMMNSCFGELRMLPPLSRGR